MPELIDRYATIDAIPAPTDADEAEYYGKVCDAIETMPTIEPEVRHGRWIAVSSFDACGGDEESWMAHGNPTAYHYCSECKNETYLNEEGKEILSDYCPFCGADMREGGADDAGRK